MIDYRADPPVIFADDFAERDNIAWRIEPAHDRTVLLEPAFPWDGALVCKGHGTVLKDPRDGLFKGWFVAVEEDLTYRRGRQEYRLVYVESRDGWQWQRPQLELCPYPGHPRTNILFDYASGGRTSYASVLVDTDDVAEPYQMFCFRDPGWKCPGGVVPGFGQGAGYGLYRYRSADGIHWRPRQGPLGIASDDTLYVHRDPDGTYVSHHKRSIPNYPGGRTPYDVDPEGSRSAFAATSADGSHWQPSTVTMPPDWLDHQGDQIMELGRHPYHGGFLGITAVYHSRHQEMDLQVAASPDGRPLNWWRPARRPCLPLAAVGEYGGGLIWPTRTLVEDGDNWVLFYGATEGLHGDPYARDESVLLFHGAFCRASWRKGRMWAAVPAAGGAHEASLTTNPAGEVRGRQLIVNVVTKPGGRLLCELLRDGSPVAGYGRADCLPVSGDQTCAVVRWREGVRCPADGLALRLYLRGAYLYGFAWQEDA